MPLLDLPHTSSHTPCLLPRFISHLILRIVCSHVGLDSHGHLLGKRLLPRRVAAPHKVSREASGEGLSPRSFPRSAFADLLRCIPHHK
jgi:hypothetical protein